MNELIERISETLIVAEQLNEIDGRFRSEIRKSLICLIIGLEMLLAEVKEDSKR
jgi:hypothetical protein